jgi:type I restriction enzyme M protein
MARKATKKKDNNSATLGFEEKMWAAADKLRGHMDPSEYKHVILGLIFLKYISDAFEARYKEIEVRTRTPGDSMYLAEEKARYRTLASQDEPGRARHRSRSRRRERR